MSKFNQTSKPYGVEAFLQEENRKEKRKLQNKYFGISSAYLGTDSVNILDLPSIYVKESLSRFKESGLNIKRYLLFENNTEILKQIRKQKREIESTKTTLHKGDVLEVLTSYRSKSFFCKEGIHLFHFDFCDALSPDCRVFMLADAVKRHMSNKAAVIITYSTRNKGNTERLNLAMNEYLKLDKVQVLYQVSNPYYDTCTMKTNLYLLRKEE